MWPFTRKAAVQTLPVQDSMPEGRSIWTRINDSLFEVMSGLGVYGRDRAVQVRFKDKSKPTFREIEAALRWCGVMQTFVRRPAADALANWIRFDNLDDEQSRVVNELLNSFGFREKLEEAAIAERQTGFAAIFFDNETLDPSVPWIDTDINSLKRLVVFDAEALEADRSGYTQYEEPQHWLLLNSTAANGISKIHSSRMIILPGNSPSRYARYQNGGKGDPEPCQIWEAWLDWLTINHVTPNVALAFESPTLFVEGLNQKMGSDTGRTAVKAKLTDFAASWSAFRTNIMDASERFERTGPPLAGLDPMYGRSEAFLAAKSGMAYSVLFGKLQQAGLGGSGATSGEEQQHEKFIARYQSKSLSCPVREMLEKLAPLLGGLDVGFEWNPIRQHSDAEWADIELKRAQRDKIYVTDMEAVTREEIRVELEKEGVYSIDPYALPDLPPDTAQITANVPTA